MESYLIELPESLKPNENVIAVDYGMSLIKVATVEKTSKSNEKTKIKVRKFVEPTEAKSYLDTIISNEKNTTVVKMGCRAKDFEFSGCDIKEVDDLRAHIAGLQVLSRAKCADQFLPYPEKGLALARQFKETIQAVIGVMSEMTVEEKERVDGLLTKKCQDDGHGEAIQFPCILVLSGAKTVALKILEDGRFTILGVPCVGGRLLQGLWSRLSKEQDFDVICEMLETHDAKAMDYYIHEVRNTDDPNDPYVVLPSEWMVFPAGKAVEKTIDDFKAGDMVKSITQVIGGQIGKVGAMWSNVSGVKQVYMAGGVMDIETIRDWAITELYIRRALPPVPGMELEFEFLRHGSYLAVIGGLFHEEIRPKLQQPLSTNNK